MKKTLAIGWVSADVFSTFGDQLYKFALPWVILADTKSKWDLSLVSATQQAAILIFGMVIGVLVDRPKRLQLMIGAVSAEAVGVAILSYLHVVGALVGVYAIIFLIATLGQIYKSGVSSVLPLVVQDGQLEQANGMIQTARTATQFLGPIVAGWLILRSNHAPFLIDATTFLVLAGAMAVMQRPIAIHLPRPTAKRSLWQETLDGVQYLRSDAILLQFAVIMALVNLGLTGALAMVVYPIQRDFHLHSMAGGVIVAVASFGSMLGSMATAGVVKRIGTMKALVGSLFVVGLGIVGMAAPAMTSFFAGYALTLAGAALFNVAILSLQQRRTPAALRGRVTSTSLVMARFTAPIGALLTGVIGAAYGVESALFVNAGIVLITAVAAAWNIRHFVSTEEEVAAR
ncbi:MAG: hypothetical protein C7B47_14755 [Sulfobacillus thermosulfidooxidans]|uniref:Major facilitator superfamily (MFS) profile domain-containing protein n=1 Tax=Sulfobacillus thermosulfidooxidans TaxID=28034 RepID=A0A2T2WQD6_SULTH|nr:MAG: hypothetical protein C7B47_14755 [Sulfobacillus thermosulfidooxidans]